MSSSFQETQLTVTEEIKQHTLNALHKLTELWTQTFESDICQDNVRKLSEHVKIFYDEVIDEMNQRQSTIINEIKRLQDEAANLERLLNVDIDISLNTKIPLYTMKIQLDSNLQVLRNQLKKRRDQIYELLVEQEKLCDELGENPRELFDDPLPTEDVLKDFRLYLDTLKIERNIRVNEISSLRYQIHNLCSQLNLPLITEYENNLLNDPYLPLTQSSLKKLRDLYDLLFKQVEETREKIEKMKKKLEVLWDFLDVDTTIKEKFKKYTGYSQDVFDKFYCELERCETEKRQNIKLFVDRTRQDIESWWEKTLKSNTEKTRFSNFASDCYTEDLLTLHELELDDLKRFYYDNEKIFTLIQERQTLWDRMEALECKAKDPGRYNNRGGQLLKEEKERKMISSKLPKIESELIQLVQNYETINNKKFTIFGELVENIIEHDWENKKEEKDKLMSARKLAVNSVTPTVNRTFKTPMSTRQNSIVKKITSSSKLQLILSSKRKPDVNPAKRSLLNSLEPKTIRSSSKTPAKPIISTTNKRKSNRLSAGKTKERRISKGRVEKKRAQSKIDASFTSDSVNYAYFKDYIGERSPCRSSIMITTEKTPIKTKIPGTPRTLRIPRENTFLNKTPGRIGMKTPSPGSSRKFTTTNLPIIM